MFSVAIVCLGLLRKYTCSCFVASYMVASVVYKCGASVFDILPMAQGGRHHIVLLGDSILDNAPYVGASPAVSDQLKEAVADRGWSVTLRAVDGAKMQHVASQMTTLPPNASLLLLSIGGNDGLAELGSLKQCGYNPLRLASEVRRILSQFETDYCRTLDMILQTKIRLVVCTIYQPYFENSRVLTTVTTAGVWLINRIIVAAARARHIPVIDLWQVFDRKEDFANSIEPGVPGGHKLIRNLLALVDTGAYLRGFSLSADATYSPGFKATGYDYWRPERFIVGAKKRSERQPIGMMPDDETDMS